MGTVRTAYDNTISEAESHGQSIYIKTKEIRHKSEYKIRKIILVASQIDYTLQPKIVIMTLPKSNETIAYL